MDDSYKTVMIDETLPVSELVDAVCKRIGITNSDEYSFQSEHDQPHMKPDTSKGKKATSGADDGTSFEFNVLLESPMFQRNGWLPKNLWANKVSWRVTSFY